MQGMLQYKVSVLKNENEILKTYLVEYKIYMEQMIQEMKKTVEDIDVKKGSEVRDESDGEEFGVAI